MGSRVSDSKGNVILNKKSKGFFERLNSAKTADPELDRLKKLECCYVNLIEDRYFHEARFFLSAMEQWISSSDETNNKEIEERYPGLADNPDPEIAPDYNEAKRIARLAFNERHHASPVTPPKPTSHDSSS